MARGTTGTLPLAFVLAMGAEASAAAVQPSDGKGEALRPGMLADLVQQAVGVNAGGVNTDQSGDRRLPGDKTALFFPNFPNFPNFFNCFNGFWRNC